MKHIITVIILCTGFYAKAQQEDSIMISKIAAEILVKGKAYENLRNL